MWRHLGQSIGSNTLFANHRATTRPCYRRIRAQRTVASAERAQNKEVAAFWTADGALREALLGNFGAAREKAGEALKLAPGSRDAASEEGLALALTGDVSRAQATADELNKKFPLNTVMQSIWLPTIHGQVAVHRSTPSAAVELLKAAALFELSSGLETLSNSCIYPAYIRGQAYLAEDQGVPAAAEFQKILDHRGLVLNCPTAALAHLGLARAYALQGDTDKAKAAY